MAKGYKPLRWTIWQIASEFGIAENTVKKRIRAESLEGGADKKFSTAEVARALFGDINSERMRKTREEADKIAIENDKRRGVLIEAEAVYRTYENVFVVLRQKILALEIPDADKDELIHELRSLKSQVQIG